MILLAGEAFRLIALPSKGEAIARSAGLPHPAILAHRGASYLAPEATQPAYLMARELGVDYLEIDVQRTRDGVLIVFHDDTLARTSNIAEVYPDRQKDRVESFTFAELQRLDVGEWYNRKFPARARKSFHGLRILRLGEVVEIAEGAKVPLGLCIETKRADRFPDIERQVLKELEGHGWMRGQASLIFQSFDPDSLARLKLLAPQIPRLFLVDEVRFEQLGWEGVVKTAGTLGAAIGPWGYGWAFGPEWSIRSGTRYLPTWPWYTRSAHQAGLLVVPWTIDQQWEMWMVKLAGADGIFTNRSELAVTVFDRSPHVDIDSLWRIIGY
jgi:glycerophosphoryl diester phosphodiesterase